MTAGHATLRALARPGVFERIAAATRRLAEGLEAIGDEEGVPVRAPAVGAMIGLWFAPRAPRNLAEARATDTARYAPYHRRMLEAGVHLPPSAFEAWFVSAAHDADVIDRVLRAHRTALRAR
jgi:glutamate-1-semialdehyde 2,1-aminomutase